jgi:hypothetical protein
MKYAILAVLCLATTVFGAANYNAASKTVTFTSPSDLSNVVDPLGQGQDLTDPTTMAGNMTKDAFNALNGLQVINFNAEITTTSSPQFNLTSTINAPYDASHTLTLTDFGDGNGYNYGGGTSQGRNQYSGPNAVDQLGTTGGGYGAPPAGGTGEFHIAQPSDIGLNWFAADLSVNQANAGVSALGFVVCGHNSSTVGVYTPAGKIWITLSDATAVSFPYVTFGGTPADANPAGIGFFYQAPAGKFITRVEATRDPGSGSSFVALDDLGFVISGGTAPHYIKPHDGDSDNSGTVDVVDLGVLAKWYDSTGLPTSAVDPFGAGSWQKGDFTNDGNVDVVDLGVLAKNYDWIGAPATAVPEPMTLSLLGLAAAAFLRRRK